MPCTGCIFFFERPWLDGEPCFDVRFEGQALPTGAIPVGMVVYDQYGEYHELLAPPYMKTVAQKKNWHYRVEEMRSVVNLRHRKEKMYPIRPTEYPYGVEPDADRLYYEVLACCPWCEETGKIQEGHSMCWLPEIPEGFREETAPILTDSGWKMLVSCPIE